MEKKRKLNSVFPIIIFIFLILYIITLFVPFVWTIITSLKDQFEYILTPMGLPEKLLFKNYLDVISVLYIVVDGTTPVYIPKLFFNGISYAFISSVILIFSNCLVAYIVSKYKCFVGDIIYILVVVNMILRVVGTLPSELQIMRALGFYNNMLGIYLMKIGFGGTNFLIFYATFKSISWSYAEAAFVDGASHYKVLFKIMLPMAKPTFFALTLMSFITYWNDWQASLVYFPSFPTIAYAVYMFSDAGGGNDVTGVPYIMAACIIVALPVIVLFAIFKNKIMGTVAIGGLKG